MNTQLRLDSTAALPSTPIDHALWQALPINPAACALLPADWARAKAVINQSKSALVTDTQKAAWATLADHLEGPVAICWYAQSQLHTPVWVARTQPQAPDPTAALSALSDWISPAADIAAPGQPPASDTNPDAPALQVGKLVRSTYNGASRWQRAVLAPWGNHGAGAHSSYRITLARQGPWITFSPDDTLVDLALDTQAHRYPSVAENLPQDAATLAVIAPRQLADLTQREAFAVLPANHDLFLQAAKTHLVPRLDALRKLPTTRALTTGQPDAYGWVTVQWQPVLAAQETTQPATAPESTPTPQAAAKAPGL